MTRLPEPRINHYQRWLRERHGLSFACYDDLWRWSVNDLEALWRSIWDYFEFASPTPYRRVLDSERMPGARCFVARAARRQAGGADRKA